MKVYEILNPLEKIGAELVETAKAITDYLETL